MSLRLIADVEQPDWARANCQGTDPDAFYPLTGQNPRKAKRICARCDIQTECLEWAIATSEPYGVWGGVAEQDRAKEIRKRNAERRGAGQVAA